MTVSLTTREFFKATPAEVAKIVRKVLYNDSVYRSISERPDGLYFAFTYQPKTPFILSTDMVVQLDGAEDNTVVTVRTFSQSFVVGDIFGSYDRLIMEFIHKLNAASDPSIVGSVQVARSYGLEAFIPGVVISILLLAAMFATHLNIVTIVLFALALAFTLIAFFRVRATASRSK